MHQQKYKNTDMYQQKYKNTYMYMRPGRNATVPKYDTITALCTQWCVIEKFQICLSKCHFHFLIHWVLFNPLGKKILFFSLKMQIFVFYFSQMLKNKYHSIHQKKFCHPSCKKCPLHIFSYFWVLRKLHAKIIRFRWKLTEK